MSRVWEILDGARWYHAYAIGVLGYGLRLLFDRGFRTNVTLPDGREIDTRYLAIAVCAITWPLSFLSRLLLLAVGSKRVLGWLNMLGRKQGVDCEFKEGELKVSAEEKDPPA